MKAKPADERRIFLSKADEIGHPDLDLSRHFGRFARWKHNMIELRLSWNMQKTTWIAATVNVILLVWFCSWLIFAGNATITYAHVSKNRDLSVCAAQRRGFNLALNSVQVDVALSIMFRPGSPMSSQCPRSRTSSFRMSSQQSRWRLLKCRPSASRNSREVILVTFPFRRTTMCFGTDGSKSNRVQWKVRNC
jgi:hypothetical protein